MYKSFSSLEICLVKKLSEALFEFEKDNQLLGHEAFVVEPLGFGCESSQKLRRAEWASFEIGQPRPAIPVWERAASAIIARNQPAWTLCSGPSLFISSNSIAELILWKVDFQDSSLHYSPWIPLVADFAQQFCFLQTSFREVVRLWRLNIRKILI